MHLFFLVPAQTEASEISNLSFLIFIDRLVATKLLEAFNVVSKEELYTEPTLVAFFNLFELVIIFPKTFGLKKLLINN